MDFRACSRQEADAGGVGRLSQASGPDDQSGPRPTLLAIGGGPSRPGQRTVRISSSGFFRFATDIEDYANWTLALILRSPDFSWERAAPGAWHQSWPGYAPTRYEQKARAAGRRPFYFTFTRR